MFNIILMGMDMEIDLGIFLGLVGIGLTILFGIYGPKFLQKRNVTQKMNMKDNGLGIQSGGDTKLDR